MTEDKSWYPGKILSNRPTIVLKEPLIKTLREIPKGCESCKIWAKLIKGRYKYIEGVEGLPGHGHRDRSAH